MKRELFRWTMTAILIVGGSVLAATAQGPARDAPREAPEELREAMHEYFEQRLRSDLSLSDEQVEEILPHVHELEQARRAARRTKGEALRTLRRGMEQGATDDELRDALDLLERTELEEQGLKLSTLAEIDKSLSVRQQVQIRFFMQRFQREMQQRIREIRGESGEPGRGRGRGPQRRRPPHGGQR